MYSLESKCYRDLIPATIQLKTHEQAFSRQEHGTVSFSSWICVSLLLLPRILSYFIYFFSLKVFNAFPSRVPFQQKHLYESKWMIFWRSPVPKYSKYILGWLLSWWVRDNKTVNMLHILLNIQQQSSIWVELHYFGYPSVWATPKGAGEVTPSWVLMFWGGAGVYSLQLSRPHNAGDRSRGSYMPSKLPTRVPAPQPRTVSLNKTEHFFSSWMYTSTIFC